MLGKSVPELPGQSRPPTLLKAALADAQARRARHRASLSLGQQSPSVETRPEAVVPKTNSGRVIRLLPRGMPAKKEARQPSTPKP